jgi:DNA-binding transcriptional ArsR family regulator
VIELQLRHHDLARIRFASSPIWEVMGSLRALADRSRYQAHYPWVRAIQPHLREIGEVDLGLLVALASGREYVLDFVTPPPTVARRSFAEELEQVRGTPSDIVRAELDHLCGGGQLPLPLRALYEDPAGQLGKAAGVLARYWQVAVAPVWPRLLALADADLARRAHHLIVGGVIQLLNDLHPSVHYDADELHVSKCTDVSRRALHGSGIVLVPCAFVWPGTLLLADPPYQPTLAYTPGGVAWLWRGNGAAPQSPLGPLLGQRRAMLLCQLELPWTTTALAGRLEMSPGTVSQHLKILKNAGLVTARRTGRAVLYQRTPLATRLLEAHLAAHD